MYIYLEYAGTVDILYGNQLLQRQHFHVSGGGGSFNYLYAVRYFNVQLN